MRFDKRGDPLPTGGEWMMYRWALYHAEALVGKLVPQSASEETRGFAAEVQTELRRIAKNVERDEKQAKRKGRKPKPTPKNRNALEALAHPRRVPGRPRNPTLLPDDVLLKFFGMARRLEGVANGRAALREIFDIAAPRFDWPLEQRDAIVERLRRQLMAARGRAETRRNR